MNYRQQRPEYPVPTTNRTGHKDRSMLIERLRNLGFSEGQIVPLEDYLAACVLLIDDVVQTGATLAAAAALLRQAGAERVFAFVAARVVGAGLAAPDST